MNPNNENGQVAPNKQPYGINLDSPAYDEPDLERRALLLAKEGDVTFKDIRCDPQSGAVVETKKTAINIKIALSATFANGTGRVPYPHYDAFKARLVDHNGNVINTKVKTAGTELLDVVQRFSIRGHKPGEIDELYKGLASTWPPRNSLIESFLPRIPEWDGVERLETYLIEKFNMRGNDYNKTLSKYFWLSLYGRITHPGIDAPIAPVFIGDQNTGKTMLVRAIGSAVMGNDCGYHKFSGEDIGRNVKATMEKITGKAIIAYAEEMAKWKSVDIGALNSFITSSSDTVEFKFLDSNQHPRQFIIICDTNRYSGIQRDESGNRRLAPMFVNQGEDKDGQPWWPRTVDGYPQFWADFDVENGFAAFKAEFWQIMAEAQRFFEAPNGIVSYYNAVQAAKSAVQELSKHDLENGRGGFADDDEREAAKFALLGMEFNVVDTRVSKGLAVSSIDLNQRMSKLMPQRVWKRANVLPLIAPLGFEYTTVRGLGKVYIARGVVDVREFKKIVWLDTTLVKKYLAADDEGKAGFFAAHAGDEAAEFEERFDQELSKALAANNKGTGSGF